jgi:hypothetical protein
MKKLTRALLIVFILLVVTAPAVSAQTYSFSVPAETVDAYYNSDGTLSLQYSYTFANDASASAIDYVDIGLPNGNFSLSNISASVDGKTITDISQADSANLNGSSNGFTLALHDNAIQPGATGTVMARVDGITGVYYKYSKGNTQNYASVRLMPNYFNSSYANGSTDLKVSLHLPQGVTPDEPQWEQQTTWGGPQDPTTALDNDGRVTYTWEYAGASASSKNEFSAAFPAKYIPTGALQTGIQLSDATISNLICVCIAVVFILIFGLAIYGSVVAARKRKLEYLPPKIAIEGHGIKRGLTAVEAAILMEEPMDKVLTMILFGVIKKGAAAVTNRDPLQVKVTDPIPAGLQPYEEEFLKANQETTDKMKQSAFQVVIVNLVKSLSEKMKGFSRKETIAYYKDINERAWKEVETADTPEVKSQKYDEVMEWTMLDKNYQGRTRDTFSTGPVFLPMWWGNFDPGYHGSSQPVSTGIPSAGSMGGGKTTITLPNLPGSDFAASVVGGTQAMAGGLVGDITNFTSGITNKTNPVPPPSSYSGGGGGGGHSCACACACAGCACACAGGGR